MTSWSNKVGFPPEDIIFDPNIFAVATGIEEHNELRQGFHRGVEEIREELPYVHISGGVSNFSFSFRGNETVREAMHSAFLFHAIKAGMDMGIVNAGQLTVYQDIPTPLREGVEDVLFNRRADATERLLELAQQLQGRRRGAPRWKDAAWRCAAGRRAHHPCAGARHRRFRGGGYRGGARSSPRVRWT